MKHKYTDSNLKLSHGEVVRVKSYNEICATLGEDGALEGLPFQTEMQKYCGHIFKVLRPVKKLIIENTNAGLRGIANAVILDGVVCDGAAHGGCSRSCFFLWKEAWLARAGCQKKYGFWVDNRSTIEAEKSIQTFSLKASSCQSISLIRATNRISRWSLRPHIWDMQDEKLQLSAIIFRIVVSLSRHARRLFRIQPPPGSTSPQGRTPTANFDLQAGDVVEVKKLGEITVTLDASGRNRGLAFTKEMRKFCGSRLTVLRNVNQIIIEGTGEVRRISHTVILKDGICDGSAHYSCRRNCYLLWRKVWLKKP